MIKDINTTRFGIVKYRADYIVHFRDGMVGFPDLKHYVLVESPQMPLVLWLQSVDDASVAFPLIEPQLVRKSYQFNMNPADESMIGYTEGAKTKAFLVMTIPAQAEQMTVNMRAPVVVNLDKSCAGQVILQDKTLAVREGIFAQFQEALNSIAAFELSDNDPKWTAYHWSESTRGEMVA